MYRLFVVFLSIFSVVCDAYSVVRTPGRATGRGGAVSQTQSGANTSQMAARSARKPGVAARSAKPVPAPKAGVVARAGAMQNVIATGTKITAAATNKSVSSQCQQKYETCMDSFCMIDNDAGGRCACDAQKQELDKILKEIEAQDMQTYNIATYGVRRVQLGDLGDGVADDVVAAIKEDADNSNQLNLDNLLSVDQVLFTDDSADDLSNKTGEDLYLASAELCAEKIPECASDMTMLQMMYKQRIKSDCLAYENALKVKKNESLQKTVTAEIALREATLEQLQNENKYDLGQCTIEFKKCMQTTAECGEDFSNCAIMRAMDTTSTRKSTRSKANSSFKIQGAITNIEISASTYDTLLAKKPLCESVTKSCTLVADQVWDTFLKDVAPQLKNAEIIAEDKLRQGCVANISECFKKACKDNIDPNDPDGSYDMCLTRPGTMLNVCKVQLDACGVNTASEEMAEQSNIWDFVLARLASMRVNACTTDVKNCLQSKDRCGSDYSQCIGLDTDTIMRMCPYDKLVGCQKVYKDEDIRGDKVYEELSSLVQGIMLNIDNELFSACQNAANEAMIRVCGETEDCKNMTTNEVMGTSSLEYKICMYSNEKDSISVHYDMCRNDISQISDKELGRIDGRKGEPSSELGPVSPFAGVLDGIIYWEGVKINNDGKIVLDSEYEKTLNSTSSNVDPMVSDTQRKKIKLELDHIQSNVDQVISTIESDPFVQFCMTGRDVQGMMVKNSKDGKNNEASQQRVKKRNSAKADDDATDGTADDSQDQDSDTYEQKISTSGTGNARFPRLTYNIRQIIANAALKQARDNYFKKYDRLNEKMMQDYVRISVRLAEIQSENAKDIRRETARYACVHFAEASILPKSPPPKVNAFGYIAAAAVVVAAVAGSVALFPFTATVTTSTVVPGTIVGASLTAPGTIVGAGIVTTTATVTTGATVAAGVAGVAGGLAVGSLAASAIMGGGNVEQGPDSEMDLELVGSKTLNQWNYQETITSQFNWETLECERCIRSINCADASSGIFSSASCKEWSDPKETCKTIQF